MANHFPETTSAWRKLMWSCRALLCEKLIALALRVMPANYSPSVVMAIIDTTREYDRSRHPVGQTGGQGERS